MNDNAKHIPSVVEAFISNFCLKKGQDIAAAGIYLKFLSLIEKFMRTLPSG